MNVLELSLVIPCHNEDKNLRPLLSAIHETLDSPCLFAHHQLGAEQTIRRKHQRCGLHVSRVQARMHCPREILQGRTSLPADLDKDGGIPRRRSPCLDKSAVLRHQSLRCLESSVQIFPRPAWGTLDEIATNPI